MTRTVTQAAWDLFKEEQRAERSGIRQRQPGYTATDAAARGRANARTQRRRNHARRGAHGVSAEHHAARVESRKRAHS